MIPVLDLSQQIRKNHGRTIVLYIMFFISVYFFIYLLFSVWTSCFGSAHTIIALKTEGDPDFVTTYTIPLMSNIILSNAQSAGAAAASTTAYLQNLMETYTSISLSDHFLLTNALFKKHFLTINLLIICWLIFAFSIRTALLGVATGITVFGHPRLPLLRSIVAKYSKKCDLPTPHIALIASRALNALTAGILQREATLIITVGLLETLDEGELEAVIAHEITHLHNRDVAVMSVSSIIVGSIGTLAEWTYWKSIKHAAQKSGGDTVSSESRGYLLLSAILLLFISFLASIGWLITSVSNLAMSRSREYEADKGAIDMTGRPDHLISALLKVKYRSEIPGVTSSMMRMCIDNPRYTLWDLFASHPTIDQRIDAIIHYAGDDLKILEKVAVKIRDHMSDNVLEKDEKHLQSSLPFGKRNFTA